MARGRVGWLACTAVLVLLCGAAGAAQDWTAADRATVRLAPAVLATVPVAIRRELIRRGCSIPQPADATRPANVVSGHFISASRTDWAVLCSRGRVSAILVFRGGRADGVAELGERPDRDYLQQTRDGRIAFSRELAVTNAAAVRARLGHASSAAPASVHDGLNDRFAGKGSVLWYWSDGRWRRLPGED
jgi:hypothetical protein